MNEVLFSQASLLETVVRCFTIKLLWWAVSIYSHEHFWQECHRTYLYPPPHTRFSRGVYLTQLIWLYNNLVQTTPKYWTDFNETLPIMNLGTWKWISDLTHLGELCPFIVRIINNLVLTTPPELLDRSYEPAHLGVNFRFNHFWGSLP